MNPSNQQQLAQAVPDALSLFLREPIAFFFTLFFPALMLFVFAGIVCNTPQELLGGYGVVDHAMGGYMGII